MELSSVNWYLLEYLKQKSQTYYKKIIANYVNAHFPMLCNYAGQTTFRTSLKVALHAKEQFKMYYNFQF